MKKSEFLEELKKRLVGLSESDIDNSVEYYGEMIDDRIDEGMNEDEAICAIGTPEQIADEILRDTSLAKIVKERVKPKRRLTTIEILLIVLGAPIWLPLLIAVFAVLFSVLASLWAVAVSLWAVALSFAAVSVLALLLTVINMIACRFGRVFLCLGTGLFFGGLALLWGVGCLYITKGLCWLCKMIFLLIKKCFVGKGRKK